MSEGTNIGRESTGPLDSERFLPKGVARTSTFLPNRQVNVDHDGLVEFLGPVPRPTRGHDSSIDDTRFLTAHPA